MSNKPKMYRGESQKTFTNNQSVYTSYEPNNYHFNRVTESIDIRKKINDIFNSPNFIYRTKVNIVADNQILTKKVVGVYNNNLVTIDNEQIPIDLITDIYR